MTSNVLKKQLELSRFEKTIEYINTESGGAKHLNSQEISYLNLMLNGEHSMDQDPWRNSPVQVKLPTGKVESFSLISNAVFLARDIISQARQMAGEQNYVEAATYLYSQLVLHHLFKDANRRTSVAATYWLLAERGIYLPALDLLELGLGDLRSKEQLEKLKTVLLQKFPHS